MNEYETRQAEKERRDLYRTAAKRLTLGMEGTIVGLHASVDEIIDKTGAFVEVKVWVSRAEIER